MKFQTKWIIPIVAVILQIKTNFTVKFRVKETITKNMQYHSFVSKDTKQYLLFR